MSRAKQVFDTFYRSGFHVPNKMWHAKSWPRKAVGVIFYNSRGFSKGRKIAETRNKNSIRIFEPMLDHVEERIIETLTDFVTRDMDKVRNYSANICIFQNYSPCSSCSESLVDFYKQLQNSFGQKNTKIKIKLEIVFSSLYNIRRQSCRSGVHRCNRLPDFGDHELNREGLRDLNDAGVKLRTFRKRDWHLLWKTLCEKLNDDTTESNDEKSLPCRIPRINKYGYDEDIEMKDDFNSCMNESIVEIVSDDEESDESDTEESTSDSEESNKSSQLPTSKRLSEKSPYRRIKKVTSCSSSESEDKLNTYNHSDGGIIDDVLRIKHSTPSSNRKRKLFPLDDISDIEDNEQISFTHSDMTSLGNIRPSLSDTVGTQDKNQSPHLDSEPDPTIPPSISSTHPVYPSESQIQSSNKISDSEEQSCSDSVKRKTHSASGKEKCYRKLWHDSSEESCSPLQDDASTNDEKSSEEKLHQNSSSDERTAESRSISKGNKCYRRIKISAPSTSSNTDSEQEKTAVSHHLRPKRKLETKMKWTKMKERRAIPMYDLKPKSRNNPFIRQ